MHPTHELSLRLLLAEYQFTVVHYVHSTVEVPDAHSKDAKDQVLSQCQ